MLRQANSATKFWAFSSLLVLTALGGCSKAAPAAGPLAPPDLPAEAAPERPKMIVSQPPAPADNDLALVHNGQKIRVGEQYDDAWAAVPKPKGANDLIDEPPIDSDAIQSSGWERKGETFSILTTRKRTLLAVYSIDQASDILVNEIIAEHEREFGPAPTVKVNTACSYRFWARGNSRLMIVDSLDARKRHGITVAIGQYEIMDKIRMSPDSADEDMRDAERNLRKIAATSAAKPASR